MTKERPDFRDGEERDREIAAIRRRLARLESEKAELEASLVRLLAEHEVVEERPAPIDVAPVTNASSPAEKIALFRALFRGREDVFPTRWENVKTGKARKGRLCTGLRQRVGTANLREAQDQMCGLSESRLPHRHR